jgi:outer membrane protein OmpA-like peptidoglycan-associated protein
MAEARPAPVTRPPPPRRAPPPPVETFKTQVTEPVQARPAPAQKPVSVEETYKEALTRQTQLPSVDGSGGDAGTVVISSEGIERANRVPSAMTAEGQQLASASKTPVESKKDLGGLLTSRPEGDTGKLVQIATIQFADGSSKLDDEARQILGQVAKLQRDKGGAVRVVGHASMRTRPMEADRHSKVNERISKARAEVVARELARLGVKRDAITATGLGDSDPVFFEVMKTGEAGNRRAEIYMEL